MRPLPRWLSIIDRAIRALTTVGAVLVVPVSLLLFLQWPLRELVQSGSREANDLAQWLFALYVAIGITCATRRRAHLAADASAARYPRALRQRLERAAALLVLLPWSLFLLYAAWPIVIQSVAQLEAFPETYNPGYFLVKAAVALLGVLVLLQALVEVAGGGRESD
jgi:TRAP-type C4-dicarboxylate transport system permease small subunit